jgi:hypothetical protein
VISDLYQDQGVVVEEMNEDNEGRNPEKGEDQTGDQGLEINTGVTGRQDEYGKDVAHDKKDKEDNTSVHTVTKSGRKVRFREDLYTNYAFRQAFSARNVLSPIGHTPSLQLAFGFSSSTDSARRESPADGTIIGCAFTQYLLKQALKRFPKEAQAAMITEMK